MALASLPLGMDMKVLCGHRGEEAQNREFNEGSSTLKWPESKHNTVPSWAVDVVPYPVDWEDIYRFKQLGLYLKGVAAGLGIELGWGGDWTRFKDYPHWELR